MSAGTCAGCGYENNSCKVVDSHILTCPEYLELFRKDPDLALTPEQEHERRRAEKNTDEAKDAREDARDERHESNVSAARARVAKQNARWSQGAPTS